MACVSDGTNVPISRAPASSSNMGSPNGSLPDLEGTGFRACTMEEKINEIYLQFPLFIQNAAGVENCVQTLAQTVAAQSTKITNIEQIVKSLMARVTSLEQNAASGSSSPDSAKSWNMLGQSNGSTATTIEIQGVDLIPSLVLKMNKLEVPSFYSSLVNNTTKVLRSGSIIFGKNPTCQHTTNVSEIIAKQVLCRPDSCSKQDPNVRTLWPDIRRWYPIRN